MDLLDRLVGHASRMERMQLFEKIEENIEMATSEQIDVRGHEVVTPMLQSGNPNKANSSSSQRCQAIPKEEVAKLPDSIIVDDVVEFLVSFLEQEMPKSPSPNHNKIWVKKMFHKIAQEIKVLCPGNPSIIKNDDMDIMSNWKCYVEELIKELRVVQRKCSLDVRNSGVYVYTKTPYTLILEMIAETPKLLEYLSS